MTEYRATRIIADKPTWYGQWRTNDRCPWRTAASDYGMIRYASEDAAVEGTKMCAEQRGEAWRAVSNGTGKRHWYVVLGMRPDRVLQDKAGRNRRFASYEAARRVAELEPVP